MKSTDEIDIPSTDLGGLFRPKKPAVAPVEAGRRRGDLAPGLTVLMVELDRLHREATGQDMPFVPEDSQFEAIMALAGEAVKADAANWKESFKPDGITGARRDAVLAAVEHLRLEVLGPQAGPAAPARPLEPAMTQAPEAPAAAQAAPETTAAPAAIPAEPTEVPAAPAVSEAPAVAEQSGPDAAAEAASVEVADPWAAASGPEDSTSSAGAQTKPTEVSGIPEGTVTHVEDSNVSKVLSLAGIVSPWHGTVGCGDEPEDNAVAPAPAETREQLLTRLGIPPRPRIWPVMMQWPPARDLELLQREGVTAEQRKAYVEGLFAKQQMMLDRAKRIDAYIRENDPAAVAAQVAIHRSRDGHYGRHDKAFKLDPFYGIAWAQLLDEKTTGNVANLVASWSHRSAHTLDGGIVRVDDDMITFGRHDGPDRQGITEQSIQLALREGMARGWKTFKLRGGHEFAAMAAKHARAMNIHCEIEIYDGLFDYRRKKLMIMPTPPVDPKPVVPGSAPAPAQAEGRAATADPAARAETAGPGSSTGKTNPAAEPAGKTKARRAAPDARPASPAEDDALDIENDQAIGQYRP